MREGERSIGALGLTTAASAVSRLINQRLMEEQSQVEELQRSLQEHGTQDDHVRKITSLNLKFFALSCFFLK